MSVGLNNTTKHHQIQFGQTAEDHSELQQRFRQAKNRSIRRQDGVDQLTHEEFLRLLLDVWELHEEREVQHS